MQEINNTMAQNPDSLPRAREFQSGQSFRYLHTGPVTPGTWQICAYQNPGTCNNRCVCRPQYLPGSTSNISA